MVEIRRGFEGVGTDRLPWLEPVEDEDGADQYVEAPAGYGGVILAAIAVLIGIAIVTAAVALYRRHAAANADLGQIIRAPEGPYKVKPTDPGGMKPDRNGEVAYGTSAGQDIDSPLDLSALPEQPVGRGPKAGAAPAPAAPVPAPPPAATKPVPVPVPVAPPVVKPAPKPEVIASAKTPAAPAETATAAPTGPTATIQLGAFSAESKANAVWKSLSGRFAYIKPLEKIVVPVEVDGKTLYRLRASGPAAASLCARLRVAGETCSVVG